MNIIFIGTSEFAVLPLKKLIDRGFNVEAVVTQPDKRGGRGKKLIFSPVKTASQYLGIDILQPENINSKSIENFILEKKIDLGVVVSYAQIISKEIFTIPKYKIINIHPSLLPLYRGPSPIQSCLLNGDIKTGVSIIEISEKMDAGDILCQKEVKIEENDDYYSLHNKLSHLGADLLINVIEQIDNITKIKQNEDLATYCKLITKEDGLINWNDNSLKIYNQIRALVAWPVSYTYFNGKILKIYRSKILNRRFNLPAGTLVRISKKSFGVVCGDKRLIEILEVQLAGKKVLKASEFLNGVNIKTGDILIDK